MKGLCAARGLKHVSVTAVPRRVYLRTRSRHSLSTTNSAGSGRSGYSNAIIMVSSAVTGAAICYALQKNSQVVSPRVVEQTMYNYADRATMAKRALAEISALLGDENISRDEDELEEHGYSEWSTSNTSVRPFAIVRPATTEEVSQIAKICNLYRVPIVPYGAGSSVEGNFSSPHSGICLSMSRMNQIIAFHEEDMDIVVQPGLNWLDMNKTIEATGLFLPMDPGPTAHIGGMIATNCSGTNAMRYGTMKDWVVNVTVVLADGSVMRTRHRPRKSSAGYNLTALFTGSEGSLGIITEATLKLATIPTKYSVATIAFPSVKHAANAASKFMRAGIPMAALELMDEAQMRIINRNGGAGGRMWKESATLFLKFSGNTQRSIDDDIVRVKAIAEGTGGGEFLVATSKQDMDSLWAARKEALWASLAVRPEGTQIWSTDVAVPLSRMAEIIELSKEESSKLGLFSSILGHVGDGNFHQSVMYNPDKTEERQAVEDCVHRMMSRAIEMEGTVSGEHGIGLGKKDCLAEELGPVTLNVMKTLKRSLDPHWILNPGKVFDA